MSRMSLLRRFFDGIPYWRLKVTGTRPAPDKICVPEDSKRHSLTSAVCHVRWLRLWPPLNIRCFAQGLAFSFRRRVEVLIYPDAKMILSCVACRGDVAQFCEWEDDAIRFRPRCSNHMVVLLVIFDMGRCCSVPLAGSEVVTYSELHLLRYFRSEDTSPPV